MKREYYELSVREPGAVAWYCAMKLEMAVALTKALLTEQMRSGDVPGRDEAKAKLAQNLGAHLGVEVGVDDLSDLRFSGHVDDEYATFERTEGGMIHALDFYGIKYLGAEAAAPSDLISKLEASGKLVAMFRGRVLPEYAEPEIEV